VLATPLLVGNTRILSAGQSSDHVGRLRFTVDGPSVRFEDYTLLPVGRCGRPDRHVQQVVDILKQQIVAFYKEDVYKRVIGWALRDIRPDAPPGRPARDTSVGNLVTDAYRYKTHSEITLAANGYIADILYRGPLVGVDLFRTVPYGIDPASRKDCPLVVVGLKGSELWNGVETTLAYLGVTDDSFLQVSGLAYAYDSRTPVGQRLVEVSVDGEPIELDHAYSVTANYAVAMIRAETHGAPLRELRGAGHHRVRRHARLGDACEAPTGHRAGPHRGPGSGSLTEGW